MVTRLMGMCATAALFVVCLAASLCGVAFGLPSERAYEQVSPAYKGGYGVGTLRMTDLSGNAVAFGALGVFAGTPWDSLENIYLARRDSRAGWTTTSLQPPPIGDFVDFSSGLEYVLATGATGQTKKAGKSTASEYRLHRTDLPNTETSWEVFGGMLLKELDGNPLNGLVVGSDDRLCHLILGYTGPLLAAAEGTVGQIYDMSRGCESGDPSLRLVGVNNAGVPIDSACATELGLGLGYAGSGFAEEQTSTFNTISKDGSTIAFTTIVKGSDCGGVHQLFMRLGGERTIEISGPLSELESCDEVPCGEAAKRASSYFKGASEDGSLVYFTTRAALAGGDKDSENDLYLAKVGCPTGEATCPVTQRRAVSTTQVSEDPTTGQPARVVGVTRVAPDGSRAYFVAEGVLTEGPNAEGREPKLGADNFYVYDAKAKTTKFIADLCSGPGLSGAVADGSCPTTLSGKAGIAERNDTNLWNKTEQAQSTRDGRFLVFTSYGQLLEDDADEARDVYRYDAVSGSLVRVSGGEGGYDANGNDSSSEAEIVPVGINPGNSASKKLELASRAISDDGSRVLFSATGPLSPRAVNGLSNVYEWHDAAGTGQGEVAMLSGGNSLTSDQDETISPSGNDVFFVTAAGLLANDTDGLRDIYDARIGGGFPEPVEARQPCSGDACQGPLSNPAPLLVPASAVQAAGENVEPSHKRAAHKRKVKRHRRSGHRRRASRNGKGRRGR